MRIEHPGDPDMRACPESVCSAGTAEWAVSRLRPPRQTGLTPLAEPQIVTTCVLDPQLVSHCHHLVPSRFHNGGVFHLGFNGQFHLCDVGRLLLVELVTDGFGDQRLGI